MLPLDDHIKKELDNGLDKMGKILESDMMAIISPILPGLDIRVRNQLEKIKDKKTIAIVLDTTGGVVEVVERMVNAIRHSYDNVLFVIPDHAMSAGTIFALSGDRIFMDYFSCLGPIDPQIERDGKLVPAVSYLMQYQRLNKKAAEGKLTSAEYALLRGLA